MLFLSKTTHLNPPEKRRILRKQAQNEEKKEAHFEACAGLGAKIAVEMMEAGAGFEPATSDL